MKINTTILWFGVGVMALGMILKNLLGKEMIGVWLVIGGFYFTFTLASYYILKLNTISEKEITTSDLLELLWVVVFPVVFGVLFFFMRQGVKFLIEVAS